MWDVEKASAGALNEWERSFVDSVRELGADNLTARQRVKCQELSRKLHTKPSKARSVIPRRKACRGRNGRATARAQATART